MVFIYTWVMENHKIMKVEIGIDTGDHYHKYLSPMTKEKKGGLIEDRSRGRVRQESWRRFNYKKQSDKQKDPLLYIPIIVPLEMFGFWTLVAVWEQLSSIEHAFVSSKIDVPLLPALSNTWFIKVLFFFGEFYQSTICCRGSPAYIYISCTG